MNEKIAKSELEKAGRQRHERLRMAEGTKVIFLKEDENYVNGDHKQLQQLCGKLC